MSIVLYLAIGFLLGVGIAAALGKFEFLKALFSEDSTASFGRVGAGIALLASIAWVSWVVYKTNAIPDLGGAALFIGTLYGLSKAGSVAQAFSGQDQQK
jgi:hypothetical protein